jgi:hypothetical protein
MIRLNLSKKMSKPLEEILTLRPEAQPRIYAYSIDDNAHKSLLKVGQTSRDVKEARRRAGQNCRHQEL